MLADPYLKCFRERIASLRDRAIQAVDGLGSAQFDVHDERGAWTIAQVFEHMRLGNAKYLPLMRESVRFANSAHGGKIAHSLFGRMIIHFAGPNGNAPAPKEIIPADGPLERTSFEAWRSQQDELLSVAEAAAGKDLARIGVRNPFFRWARMNLADCFEILAAHTERHVAQIESRAAALRK